MESADDPAARRLIARWRILLTALAVLVASAVIPLISDAPARADQPRSWNCPGVAAAPVLGGDTNHGGSPIVPVPDGRGKWVPVLFVHGWTGRSTHDQSRSGDFSKRIDLTAVRGGDVDVPRSAIGQIQTIPGAATFTFDYHDISGRWVTDDGIGAALGSAIDCMYERSGEKVIVVAHSMGGLATRQALALRPERADRIGTVVTFGTPNTGSLIARVLDFAATGAALTSREAAVLRLILAVCGQTSAESLNNNTCANLPNLVQAADGPAGRALRWQSAELRRLPPIPDSVPVHALYGDIRVQVAAQWFGSPMPFESGVGDFVVTADSAVAGSASAESVQCDYEVVPQQNAADALLTDLVKIRARSETPAPAARIFFDACFHTNLMRSIELTNAATIAVEDDIVARQLSESPTRVEHVIAVTTDGVPAPGFSVVGDIGPVSCLDRPSPVAVDSNIYICTPTAAGADVCWPESGRRTLLCGNNPWEQTLRRATASEPPLWIWESTRPEPWGLELVDGTRCRIRNGGSWPGRPDGLNGAYHCDTDNVFVLADPDGGTAIDTSNDTWRVMIGDLSDSDGYLPPPTTAAVRTAWFADADRSDVPIDYYFRDWIGTWSGQVQGDRVPYSVEVIIEPAGVFPRGSVVYPELQCGGRWDIENESRPALIFRETIEYETGSCIDESIVEITPNGSAMDYVIRYGDRTLTARLTRADR